jgi:hypothetical protein
MRQFINYIPENEMVLSSRLTLKRLMTKLSVFPSTSIKNERILDQMVSMDRRNGHGR